MLNYIATGITISMWLSSTMTLDFPRGFYMVMHGYSEAHSSVYYEAWWNCGPSDKRKETIDHLWRELQQNQSALWNTTQIGAHSQIGPDAPIVFHSQKNHEMVQKRCSTCLLYVALYHGNRIIFSPKYCGTCTFLLRV